MKTPREDCIHFLKQYCLKHRKFLLLPKSIKSCLDCDDFEERKD